MPQCWILDGSSLLVTWSRGKDLSFPTPVKDRLNKVSSNFGRPEGGREEKSLQNGRVMHYKCINYYCKTRFLFLAELEGISW